ncbi:MAG: hypothetical protein PVF33_11705 [Candidatus Latescibacterota bacterium]
MASKRGRVFWAAAAALVAALSCGDSDDTPLGSQFIGDLLGSRPGTVFEDTIRMAGGDTSYAFYTLIDKQDYLEVGQDDGYVRTALLRPNVSSGDHASQVVEQANLRLRMIEDDLYVDLTARFYELGTEYSEGDTIQDLDTTFVIPDTLGQLDRRLQLFPPNYPLPPDLVQSWIRGETPANGIAIIYQNTADELFGCWSRTGTEPPTLDVTFTDGSDATFSVAADGIYTRPTTTTDNLVISDGYVRRIYLPVDIGAIEDSSAVHEARLVLTYVPGSVFGTSQNVLLYIPVSSDPDSSGFSEERRLITQATLDESAGTLELKITNALLTLLSGAVENNGFVLRLTSENSEVRQAEFYTSADPDRGPRIYITYSTPAEFEE